MMTFINIVKAFWGYLSDNLLFLSRINTTMKINPITMEVESDAMMSYQTDRYLRNALMLHSSQRVYFRAIFKGEKLINNFEKKFLKNMNMKKLTQ
jgi:hypothetical protein